VLPSDRQPPGEWRIAKDLWEAWSWTTSLELESLLCNTPSIPNYKTFDFFDLKFDTRLIQKIYTNRVKFKSFL
jgi:hypothetical protein